MKQYMCMLIVALMVGGASNLSGQQTQETRQPANQYDAGDYVKIQREDLPVAVRKTLKYDSYNGWEDGEFFGRTDGDRYLVRIGSGNTARIYFFDQRGKPIIDDPKKDSRKTAADMKAEDKSGDRSGNVDSEKKSGQ